MKNHYLDFWIRFLLGDAGDPYIFNFLELQSISIDPRFTSQFNHDFISSIKLTTFIKVNYVTKFYSFFTDINWKLYITSANICHFFFSIILCYSSFPAAGKSRILLKPSSLYDTAEGGMKKNKWIKKSFLFCSDQES